MKLSDILVVTLFLVMGSLIFVMKKMQASEIADSQADVPSVIVTAQNPASVKIDMPSLSAAQSRPEMAGSYGRLSLDSIITAEAEPPVIEVRDSTPRQSAETLPEEVKTAKPQRQDSKQKAGSPPSL